MRSRSTRSFGLAIKHNASDIHLQVGRPPIFRIRGGLKTLDMSPITESQMIELTFPMMDQRNLDIFHRDGGADFSKVVELENDPWRFRVNLLTQLGARRHGGQKGGAIHPEIRRTVPAPDHGTALQV